MAQSGFTPIQLYRSATPGAVPTAGNLAPGELALNTADEKLFFENASGVVVSIDKANGTVTSVNASGGFTGLTFSGGPITTSGTLTLSGTLVAVNGGTGQSSYAVGDILFASTTTALSKLADVATGNALISGGVGVAPSYGKIGLTTHVSGTLPVANGGTGQTTYTNGQLLIGNTTGNTLAKATLTAGTNISITNGAGTITINSTDQFVGTVTSVAASGGTTGMTFSGGPITGSGTLTLAGTLAVANGGTGVTTSTGTGSVVLSNSPVLVTPTLGAASATSIANGLGAVGTPSYTFIGDLNTGMWSPAADTLAFSEGGVEAMRITSAGNVGIGTSAPAVTLDVAGTIRSARNNAEVRITTATGYGWRTGTTSTASTLGYMYFQGTTDNFATSFIDSMAISSTGNVGIGTTAPTAKLTVSDTSPTDGIVARFNNTTNALGVESGIRLEQGSSAQLRCDLVTYRAGVNAGVDFAIKQSDNTGTSQTRFYITELGNVGIGTSSPTVKLSVVGAQTLTRGLDMGLTGVDESCYVSQKRATVETIMGPISTRMLFGTISNHDVAVQTNSTERMRITSAGNVGIGTTSISYKLEVAGDVRIAGGGGDLRIQSATGTTTSGGDSQIYNDANDMVFTTGTTTTERFRIGSVGQWGIGGATYGTSGQVFSSQGASTPPTWLTIATVATSGSFADLSNKPGVRSNGQNVISGSKTLGSADNGTNILLVTSGITITFPATGFASGEGFAISNISGGNVTLSAPGGSDFGATLPDDASLFVFCDGGGFWRQYCYSTSRL